MTEFSLKGQPLKDITAVGISIASIFAFAFVIWYFYAYDIAWFPFFSFSEHLVFALRALPIALGALVVLLIVLNLPERARALLQHEIHCQRTTCYLFHTLSLLFGLQSLR